MTVSLRLPRFHALAALVAALAFLGRVRVHAAGCAVPLPALVLTAGVAVCLAAAVVAVCLIRAGNPARATVPRRYP